ncbi:MAG: translocation/assembly module TamB, partial [Tannerella sp.]|nr:translocation/assembly module TamB [Tannerella sp.]
MQIPQIQETLAAKVCSMLSRRLNVPVEIGRVDLDWYSRLVVRDVLVRDRQADTLFIADHVSAGINWLSLVRGRCVFTDVRLVGFTVHMRRATRDGESNFQFAIDAFASRDTTVEPTIDLQIESIQLRRGHVSYHVADEPELLSEFDPQHIQIRDLDGQIRLNVLTADSLNVRIDRLKFREHSGFVLDRLSFDLTANADSASVRNLAVRLPSTSLRIDTADVRYHEPDSMSLWTGRAPVRLKIEPSQICLKDIAAFVPAFAGFSSIIDISAEASGCADNFSLNDLRLEMNHAAALVGKISLTGITRRGEAFLSCKIDRASATAEGLVRIINHFKAQPATLPASILQLDDLHFSGEISGFFDHLVAYGNLQSNIGSIDMDLIVGSKKEENRSFYLKGQIASAGLQLDKLFDRENDFGTVCFQGEVDASRQDGELLSGNIHMQINEADYRGYRYENILLSGNFSSGEY